MFNSTNNKKKKQETMALLKSSHSLAIVVVVILATVYRLENITLPRCFAVKSRKQTGSITIMAHELERQTIGLMLFKGSGTGTGPFRWFNI